MKICSRCLKLFGGRPVTRIPRFLWGSELSRHVGIAKHKRTTESYRNSLNFIIIIIIIIIIIKHKTNSVAFGPQANYIDASISRWTAAIGEVSADVCG
jgi:hypothetical protein